MQFDVMPFGTPKKPKWWVGPRCWLKWFEFVEKAVEACWSQMEIQTRGTSKMRKVFFAQDEYPDVVHGLAKVEGWSRRWFRWFESLKMRKDLVGQRAPRTFPSQKTTAGRKSR